MKKWLLIFAVCSTLVSCKMLLKGAAKHWTKTQIKEFLADCEKHSAKLMSDDKAKAYCDCAVDIVAEKYTNYDDMKNAGLVEVLKVAKDCKD